MVRDVFEDAYNYMKSGQLLRQVVNKINDVDFNNLDERRHFGVPICYVGRSIFLVLSPNSAAQIPYHSLVLAGAKWLK